MRGLDQIGDRIREYLEKKSEARDRALQQSRSLIRCCSIAIREVHREEHDRAKEHLAEARRLAQELRDGLAPYPDLYHAGYSRDALKEFAEASIVEALVSGDALPEPEDLGIEFAAYLGGLGEAVGELRRRSLDLLRKDSIEEAEALLVTMDEIYGLLVTLDFPSALTGNLRRTTDMVRGVTERTRGDLTTASRQKSLRESLRAVEKKLDRS